MAARRGLPHEAAARDTERHDAERRRFIHRHFGCDIDDPCLYTMQLDSAALSLDEIVGLILHVVAWRARTPVETSPV